MGYLQKAHRRGGEEDYGRRSGHCAQAVHQATATDQMKQEYLTIRTKVSYDAMKARWFNPRISS